MGRMLPLINDNENCAPLKIATNAVSQLLSSNQDRLIVKDHFSFRTATLSTTLLVRDLIGISAIRSNPEEKLNECNAQDLERRHFPSVTFAWLIAIQIGMSLNKNQLVIKFLLLNASFFSE